MSDVETLSDSRDGAGEPPVSRPSWAGILGSSRVGVSPPVAGVLGPSPIPVSPTKGTHVVGVRGVVLRISVASTMLLAASTGGASRGSIEAGDDGKLGTAHVDPEARWVPPVSGPG